MFGNLYVKQQACCLGKRSIDFTSPQMSSLTTNCPCNSHLVQGSQMCLSLPWVSSPHYTRTLGPRPSAFGPWESVHTTQPSDTTGDSHMTMLTLPTTLSNWLDRFLFCQRNLIKTKRELFSYKNCREIDGHSHGPRVTELPKLISIEVFWSSGKNKRMQIVNRQFA